MGRGEYPKTTDAEGYRLRDGRRVRYHLKDDSGALVPPSEGFLRLHQAVEHGAPQAARTPSGYVLITRDVARRVGLLGNVSTITSHTFRLYPDGAIEIYWHRTASRTHPRAKGFATWVARSPLQVQQASRQMGALGQLQDMAHVAERLGYGHAHRVLASAIADEFAPPEVEELLRMASARARRTGNLQLSVSIEMLMDRARKESAPPATRLPLMRRILQGIVG